MNDETYTVDEVMALLRRLRRLELVCYNEGLAELLPTIIDTRAIIEQLNLTERQADIMQFYFFEEYTQDEIARMMNTSQVTVSHSVTAIKKKVAEVLSVA